MIPSFGRCVPPRSVGFFASTGETDITEAQSDAEGGKVLSIENQRPAAQEKDAKKRKVKKDKESATSLSPEPHTPVTADGSLTRLRDRPGSVDLDGQMSAGRDPRSTA